MAYKVQNVSNHVVPVIVPGADGGVEMRLAPRQIVVLAIKTIPAQIQNLVNKGILKIRK